ncbi:MAG TPA: sigma factor-like helix-turn-helix DNA-binding protein, partial [Verrucomicrobiae bacterium]|nr:sigma factor-like helix-turn-helix DNA-binding protein [Verrucomicrobiae bacterium]
PHDGERILLAKENLQIVVAALNELPQRTRDVFLLSRLERIPHAQLAEMFAISVSAIQQHIVKATKHLATRTGERS